MCAITNNLSVICPQCGIAVPWVPSQAYRPFCSKRCQLIDYGDWVTEQHSIPATPNPDEMDSDFYLE